MRRAEWRERADDPKTPFGWCWRGFVRGGWPFDASLVAATWLLSAFVPLVWALIVGMAVKVVAGGVGALIPRDDLKPLLTDPAIQGQFRALATYRRDGVVTGRDEMALTVVDGWLVAEGVRSEFAIRPQDVRSSPGILGEGYPLALTDGSKITFGWLPEHGRRVLDAWRQFEVCSGGEPTFPPATVHPQEMARWSAWSALGLGWIGMPSALCSFFFGSGFFIPRMLLAFAGGGMFYWTRGRLNRLIAVSVASRPDALAGQAPSHQGSLEEANVHVA